MTFEVNRGLRYIRPLASSYDADFPQVWRLNRLMANYLVLINSLIKDRRAICASAGPGLDG